MGCCMCCPAGITPEERAAIHASTLLDKNLVSSLNQDLRVLKLLLLGTGESGKSTIFKQMQILYEEGFSEIEKSTFRHVIRANVVESMQTLISAMDRFQQRFQNPESKVSAKSVMDLDPLSADFWFPGIVPWVTQLWKREPAIANVYAQRSKMQLLDSASYFFENLARIGPDDYVPTADDILRARLRTSGIVERKFKINQVDFKFLDVGGQRNERRKWIHCFEGVTSVIFVAAISEYDQVLYEDQGVNRLSESVEVFSDVCNNKYFEETAMILFLNKIDLFEDKLQRVALRDWFPDFTGENNFEEASEYIQSKFLAVNQRKEKMVFCHLTCATDTQNVDRVFEACKLVILKDNLEKLGLN